MIIKTVHSKDNTKVSRFQKPLKIKVLASQHSFGFVFRSLSGELIDLHIGLLPTDFQFNRQTAELFALAEAARRLGCEDMQSYRVALVCSSLPYADQRQRRAA